MNHCWLCEETQERTILFYYPFSVSSGTINLALGHFEQEKKEVAICLECLKFDLEEAEDI